MSFSVQHQLAPVRQTRFAFTLPQCAAYATQQHVPRSTAAHTQASRTALTWSLQHSELSFLPLW